MKNWASVFTGHNSCVTVYDVKNDRFIIIELDKVTGEKHYSQMKKGRVDLEGTFRDISSVLNILKEQFGIENDFHFVDINSKFDSQGSQITLKGEKYYPVNYKENVEYKNPIASEFNTEVEPYTTYQSMNHHENHAWCAYGQSGMKDAFALCWDGGGDTTCFAEYHIKDGQMTFLNEEDINMNWPYRYIGSLFPTIRGTHKLDIAGKLMGMAAYSDELDEDLYAILPRLCNIDPIGEIEGTYWEKQVAKETAKAELYDSIKLKINRRSTEMKTAYTIQKHLEDFAVKYIESKLDVIEECGNNVIMSGGISLNVLTNELLKTKFPWIKFYVPSNPHDGGLAFGSLWYLLHQQGIVTRNDYDITYAGPEIIDREEHAEREFTEVELSDVADLLREGNIIGFVNGGAEVGPRALGNRSILCDASYPGMKKKINANVKRRESFRPFAPACALEDAPKYFESINFDNMEAMQYVVKVKKEYHDKLEPITHVDGTARLQTVSEDKNPVFYKLIKLHGGVLLNTSFNLAGKPTLNCLKDAFEMLDNTKLDCVVVGDREGKFKLYK